MRPLLILFAATLALSALPIPLDEAYRALQARQYDTAIDRFRQAIVAEPNRASIHKDLAYTYLKIGDTASARDAFGAAMSLDPADGHTALEYAFLCYETKRTQMARRIFQQLQSSADPAIKATASTAFHNIDQPLADGIARWTQALALSPDNFSAHFELAGLAEDRGEPALAIQHYQRAWQLKPQQRELLLKLARLFQSQGRAEDAFLYVIAASRGAEPHTAEAARALLNGRYPYVYEFERALSLDPTNPGLRRELAYLHLEMNQRGAALREFEQVVGDAPADLLAVAQLGFLYLENNERERALPLLQQVLDKGDPALADRVRQALKLPQQLRVRQEAPHVALAIEAKELAERSLKAGYLKDAVKYLQAAHANDPVDFGVMRQLGWTYNILKQDDEAAKWFALASRSDDPVIASETSQAYRNLKSSDQTRSRFHASLWVFPTFSSRWHDTFTYGQVKLEYRLAPQVTAYLSARLVGDARSTFGPVQPIYLSETAMIAAFGLTTRTWHGARLWGEAGSSINYLKSRKDVGHLVPDYRGGLAFGRAIGRHITGKRGGLFAETHEDLLYLSRFNKDFILYSQNRFGITLPPLGALHSQVFWNANLTADQKRQYWASFAETGPGVRFRVTGMPPSVYLTVSMLRGFYLIQEGNPNGPQFNDLRVGAWYALAR